MEPLPYKRMLVRTLLTPKGEQPLMFIDLTGNTPVIEPFGGIERHSTVFIDGIVTLLTDNTATHPTPFLLKLQ